MAHSLSSASTSLIDGKAPPLQPPAAAAASSQCVTLPAFPPPHYHHHRARNATAYRPKMARDVAEMVTGDAPAEVAAVELPEFVKPIQEAFCYVMAQWEKVEDKYAVGSLAVAAGVALWCSTGMISAVDKLPLIPGVLELVGIGYTGWFAYKNLIFKPDRQALVDKIKRTYRDIIGTS